MPKISKAQLAARVDVSGAPLLTTKELEERGLRPRSGEAPALIEEWKYHSRRGTRNLWRLDQAIPKAKRDPKPAALDLTPDNVLRATWTVNRAAKRRRDAATSSYEQDLHGFAGHHRQQKEDCYRLKDIGIAWLAMRGHLAAAYKHGGLAVWVGEGFCFHSTLAPKEPAELPDRGGEPVMMEAKPRAAQEMRIIDAVALLGSIRSEAGKLARLTPEWQRPKPQRMPASEKIEEDDDGECDSCWS